MQHTTKAALLDDIEDERRALNDVIAKLSPEQFGAPGANGEWTLKDSLAHLAVWCARAVTLLFQAERGASPSYGVPSGPNWIDAANARDCATQKDRPLDHVLADFHGAHRQLVKRLTAWHDEPALFDPHRYPSLNGRSLATHVWACSAEHDAEHRRQIEAWLRRESEIHD